MTSKPGIDSYGPKRGNDSKMGEWLLNGGMTPKRVQHIYKHHVKILCGFWVLNICFSLQHRRDGLCVLFSVWGPFSVGVFFFLLWYFRFFSTSSTDSLTRCIYRGILYQLAIYRTLCRYVLWGKSEVQRGWRAHTPKPLNPWVAWSIEFVTFSSVSFLFLDILCGVVFLIEHYDTYYKV